MERKTNSQKEGIKEMKSLSKNEAIEVLNMFQGLGKLFWLNTMVKQGLINKVIAGQIIIEKAV